MTEKTTEKTTGTTTRRSEVGEKTYAEKAGEKMAERSQPDTHGAAPGTLTNPIVLPPGESPHKPWDEAQKDIEAETKAYRDAQREQREERGDADEKEALGQNR